VSIRLLRSALVAVMAVATTSTIHPAAATAGSLVSGDQRWATRFSSGGQHQDVALAEAVSPDGTTVYVVGSRFAVDHGTDARIAAYDTATGTQRWSRTYDGPAASTDSFNSVGVTPDGSAVFAAGPSTGAGTQADYLVVAFQTSGGSILWSERYDAGVDQPVSLAVSPDGSAVYVTGASTGAGHGRDYLTLALSAVGAQLWAARYDGPGHGDDFGESVVVDPSGSAVYVTGDSAGAGTGLDYATVAYDAADGHAMWGRRFSGPGMREDDAVGVAVTPDGSTVLVTGDTRSPSSQSDLGTVAYDAATGAFRWAQAYDGALHDFDFANSLAVSPDSSAVFVTGWADVVTDDMVTIAYDVATGTPQWTSFYDDPEASSDAAYDVTVSPDGATVYVTGNGNQGATGWDYTTIAYDAESGTPAWTATYSGPGSGTDTAGAVAVTPDGSTVIITGQSQGKAMDWATVAYQA
jgi:outer membrane protein assembly factor BamB